MDGTLMSLTNLSTRNEEKIMQILLMKMLYREVLILELEPTIGNHDQE